MYGVIRFYFFSDFSLLVNCFNISIYSIYVADYADHENSQSRNTNPIAKKIGAEIVTAEDSSISNGCGVVAVVKAKFSMRCEPEVESIWVW